LKTLGSVKFEPDHVATLVDAGAGRTDILNTVVESWLTKKALPDDLIVVYICGRILPSSDHSDVILCSYDVTQNLPTSSGVPLKRLLADLQSRTQSKQIICFLDTSPSILPTAATDIKATDLTKVEQVAADCKITVFSASELFQPSFENLALGNSQFCHYLIDGLHSGNGQIPLGTVTDYVIQNVRSDAEQRHKSETPVLNSSPDTRELATVALGCATRVSSIKRPNIGYPIGTLAQRHPEFLPKFVSKREANDNRDEDDDQSQEDVDMRPYVEKMRKDIQAKWKAPQGMDNRMIITVFTIQRDGTITDAHIVDGTGNEQIDKSALDALHDASPLSPLPAGAPKSVQMQYKFDWHVSRQ
jgi:TonB family protein